jgi:predicted RNA-binding Zn ribbon-like protein
MSPELSEFQAAGFPMGGEPLVALDLVDTLVLTTEPWTDLIADSGRHARWWELQSRRLPAGDVPGAPVARHLRAVIRALFDAHLEGCAPDPVMVEDLNAIAASVPTSPRIVGWGPDARLKTRWHNNFGGNPAMAAIAGEALGLLADPRRLGMLRRCANPACSMLFLAENKRRVWCTATICGNRARVARHYERGRHQA